MILVAEHPLAWLMRLLPRRQAAAPATHRFRLRMRRGMTEVVAEPHRGFDVLCERGQLWITHDGDRRDVVLESGDSYTPDNPGRMVILAVSDSEIAVAFTNSSRLPGRDTAAPGSAAGRAAPAPAPAAR